MNKTMELPATSWSHQMGEVYTQYYQRYRNSVFQRTCRRLSRYHVASLKQEAEDLCQETFQSAYRWMRNYWEAHRDCPPEAIFERVLRTIEVNEYRTHMKRAKYPIGRVAPPARSADRDLDSVPEEPSIQSTEPNPEEELLWKEYETKIHYCLKKLKSSESSALLCKIIGYSDKEVADLLGEPQKKVMYSIIPLGRKKLRKCMEGYINGYRQRPA